MFNCVYLNAKTGVCTVAPTSIVDDWMVAIQSSNQQAHDAYAITSGLDVEDTCLAVAQLAQFWAMWSYDERHRAAPMIRVFFRQPLRKFLFACLVDGEELYNLQLSDTWIDPPTNLNNWTYKFLTYVDSMPDLCAGMNLIFNGPTPWCEEMVLEAEAIDPSDICVGW